MTDQQIDKTAEERNELYSQHAIPYSTILPTENHRKRKEERRRKMTAEEERLNPDHVIWRSCLPDPVSATADRPPVGYALRRHLTCD